jgi:alkylhydroperoxidase/carboxymuconolactone decarboxylase family protein YurZ
MSLKNWAELLAEYSAELGKLLREDAEFLAAESALPSWVKYLMAMQIDSVFGKPDGAKWYGRLAREAGATEAQIVEAIKILRIFAGRPATATGTEALRKDE